MLWHKSFALLKFPKFLGSHILIIEWHKTIYLLPLKAMWILLGFIIACWRILIVLADTLFILFSSIQKVVKRRHAICAILRAVFFHPNSARLLHARFKFPHSSAHAIYFLVHFYNYATCGKSRHDKTRKEACNKTCPNFHYLLSCIRFPFNSILCLFTSLTSLITSSAQKICFTE